MNSNHNDNVKFAGAAEALEATASVKSRDSSESAPIFIAAGGTGGHIMPAIAVGAALRRLQPGISVEFVCGMRPVELRAYWNSGEQPHLLRCGKSPGTGMGGMQRWIQLLRAIPAARKLVAARRPRVILGMGGYIVAPVLLAACRLKIPMILHESNAVAGQTTRLFSRWARETLLSEESAVSSLPSSARWRVAGTPVRDSLFQCSRAEGAAAMHMDPNRKTILLLGGSQGARSVNRIVLESLPLLEDIAEKIGGLQLLWSAGAANFPDIHLAIQKMQLRGLKICVHPSIDRMDAAYACCDLVITRAGAGTLAEVTALGLPSILIPFPQAKDDHQRKNAIALEAKNAAILIEEKALSAARLKETIESLLGAEKKLAAMRSAALAEARPGAAEFIAKILLGMDPSSILGGPSAVETQKQISKTSSNSILSSEASSC